MSEILTRDDTPAGFTEAPSGLVVPDDYARVREVWTRDEWRLMDRALKLLRSRNLAAVLKCNTPECQGHEIAVLVDESTGDFTWRCKHKDRVFHRQI